MRVTLDTNVLVSAFISKLGNPADILELALVLDEITLVLSEEILEEFREVMTREEVRSRFGYSTLEISAFQEAIKGVAEIVTVGSDFKAVKEDPKDDKVVNTAFDGKAEYIVSGDKHLLKLGKFKGIRIVSPATFRGIVAKKFEGLVVSRGRLE